MGLDDFYGDGKHDGYGNLIAKVKKPSKIEDISTESDYKRAKKVVERYKTRLRNEIKEEQKNCNHKSFYRYEYDEDHYINVCRSCFHEWEEKNMPFLLEDYFSLTQGVFKKTEKDRENYMKYKARIEAIDKL
jgi:hypothetical protein